MVNSGSLRLDVMVENWPIAGTFTISRGAKTKAVVVVAALADGKLRGRGECVPYARYGETVEGVAASIRGLSAAISGGLGRLGLQAALPPGAARNALDCAFWDFEAKRAGRPVHALAGLLPPRAPVTALTISLGTPQAMTEAAERASARKLLKIKLGGDGDAARIAAVRRAVPNAELIADANEAWRPDNVMENLAACADAGVTLVEQPLPDGSDAVLATFKHPVPVCADESVHDRTSLAALVGRYDAVNIKLDKTGGLTEAFTMVAEAEQLGFQIMIGCMVATSLSMAPALLLAQKARFVDLDGALLLAKDRPDGLVYEGSLVHPPTPALWG